MTTTDEPIPAYLAVPDGEPEPVSESSLTWLEEQVAADPTVTFEEVLHEAEQVASNPALPPSPGAYPEAARELAEAQAAAQVAYWEVTDDSAAEWAMRKLRDTEAEADEVAAQASAWMDEIQRWREERLRPLESRRGFFTAKLTDYLRRLREENERTKSRSLPSGTISSRTVPAKVEVVDVDAVAAWAREAGHGDVLKVTVRLTELRKAVTVDEEGGVVRDPDSGQPIEGATVHPSGISFSVRVGG